MHDRATWNSEFYRKWWLKIYSFPGYLAKNICARHIPWDKLKVFIDASNSLVFYLAFQFNHIYIINSLIFGFRKPIKLVLMTNWGWNYILVNKTMRIWVPLPFFIACRLQSLVLIFYLWTRMDCYTELTSKWYSEAKS